MNTTPGDTTDTPAGTARKRAPRQRAKNSAPSQPKGYATARAEFERRAQDWLLSRPGRTMQMPQDLAAVVALGVPCRTCGAVIYRQGTAGHTIEWQPSARSGDPGLHWSTGITAYCATAA